MNDLKSKLVQLGFTQKEASVYFTALQLEVARANDIANLSGVNRATTYSVLKSLVSKGLITQIKQSGETRYAAESPNVIHSLLALQEQELTLRKQIASPIVNRLQVFFQRNQKKPRIRYVESAQGLSVMQKEYEQLDEDILQIVGYDTFVALYGDEVNENHQSELANQKRRTRSIFVTDQELSFPKSLNIEYATISPELAPVKGEMTVCGDRLALFSYSDGLVAIDIKSTVIAEMVRSTLELAWKEAKKWGRENKNTAD